MAEIYIKEIKVNKVRHLHDFTIPISDNERKHLILTGKNGSGKTSVLIEIKNSFIKTMEEQKSVFRDFGQGITSIYNNIKTRNNLLEKSANEDDKIRLSREIDELHSEISFILRPFTNNKNVILRINNFELLLTEFLSGGFVIAYFDAKRSTQFGIPNGIQKLEIKPVYQIEDKANQIFIQYLVNLKAQRSFARDEGNDKVVEDIDNWFYTFEMFLKELFEDNQLKLEFDSGNFDFHLIQKNREKFDLNKLSDGYSSILNIITELIVRMEKKSSRTFELQGVVLIDEIETHLHIELQKIILPFLLKIFPKIQFIVTTHSPFILNSISNSVIFDLENQTLVSDLSGYSVEGIIEGYFDSDKYSQILKQNVEEYENLLTNNKPSDIEKERINELKKYFKNLSKFMAPELELKINQLELSNII